MKSRRITVPGAAALDEHAGWWRELVERSPDATIFQTYEFNRAWFGAFGDRPLELLVLEDSAPQCLLPLAREQRRVNGLSENLLCLAGGTNFSSDFTDAVRSASAERELRAVLDPLAGDDSWSVLEITNIISGSPLLTNLSDLCRAKGWRCEIAPLQDAMFVDLGDAERVRAPYAKGRERSRLNKIISSPGFSFGIFKSESEILPRLETLFELHRKRWGPGKSQFSDERHRAFYRELTRLLAPHGWAHLSILDSEDGPLAAHFGFEFRGRLYWYKPAFDPEKHTKNSPGNVHLILSFEYCIEHGIPILDFGAGGEQYKCRFATGTRKLCFARVYRRPLSRLTAGLRRAAGRARRALHG